MEVRGGPSPAAMRRTSGPLAAFVALGVLSAPALATPPARRAISVRLLADAALRTSTVWKVDMVRALGDASRTLEEVAGITLKARAHETWKPSPAGLRTDGPRRPAVVEAMVLLNREVRAVGRNGADIVLLLVPEGPEGPATPGIADYIMGTVVIKYLKSKAGIPYVLLHELCHIFGAIDLKTGGSVMSLQGPGFRIDGFTRAILRANRDRAFSGDGFPLPGERIPEAIGIYEGRRVLGLGEEELAVCLASLRRTLASLRRPPS